MGVVQDILAHNRAFVANKEYVSLETDRYPNKRVLVVTCMDARLTELLPQAMDLRQGDAKILKTAGAVVNHPFGSIMRSILVGVYNLEVDDILIVGHHDCGMASIRPEGILQKARERGIDDMAINVLRAGGIDLNEWLRPFESVQAAVRQSVQLVRSHPLLPRDVRVHGMIMDPHTGALESAEGLASSGS